ncbi:MAG: SDR family oxidoreductase [Acidobacteriota bacterium]|nr:SDR family oxidoreductase [Acidobacteriota bacterium]
MSEKKIALVTGANKGIGFETARQLAQEGITVLLGARDERRGAEAAATLRDEGLDARFLLLDLNDETTHESAAEFIEAAFGRLDILVNNAAVNLEYSEGEEVKPASQTPLDIYRQTFETNFFALISVTRKLLPLIKKSAAGRIVNLSSTLASNTLHSDPNSFFYNTKIPAYDASKTSVNSFTVHLAYELKDTPIKVNAADPGWVKTDMGGEDALLEVEEGAKTPVALATLPDNGFTGKYVHLGEELPW